MARQHIRYTKRREKSLRSKHVLVLVLSALFSVNSGSVSASPEFSQPTQDVIDLCTWTSADRTSIAKEFSERGWTKFRAPFPELMPLLVADGFLSRALANKSFNPLALDTETGVIPSMGDHFEAISDDSERGIYDAFWWDHGSLAFLVLYDHSAVTPTGDRLGCNYFSTSYDDTTRIRDAIWAFETDTLGTTLEYAYGPSRYLSVTTWGYAPHQTSKVALGSTAERNASFNRPVPEPQLGAGPAKIVFLRFDEAEFESAFDRKPHAAFTLEIKRRMMREN
ncbi:hypothetical protein [uncultured Ruegeria sp.]|uniref:hypothetical protein n=1 Tax=uncultured Ruegeria sp. TaxID=259304 RepID=UPI00262716FF|nr:hypothetical protein [uncultured Ruegeria sp.]